MKPVFFRGQNYDAMMLARLQGQGHTVQVPTQDIITMISSPSVEARIAFKVDGKYHLLTGSIDPKAAMNPIHVVSHIVLKKALVQTSTYAERQQDSRDARHHRATHGFNDYGSSWRR